MFRPNGFQVAVDQLFQLELDALAAAGAILVDVNVPDYAGADEYVVLTFEFKAGINAYLASHARSGQPGTLAELIDFNTANSSDAVLRAGDLPRFTGDL